MTARLTGVPMVLNTSFDENEPIVMTPADALETFRRTRIDLTRQIRELHPLDEIAPFTPSVAKIDGRDVRAARHELEQSPTDIERREQERSAARRSTDGISHVRRLIPGSSSRLRTVRSHRRAGSIFRPSRRPK